ncbi:hypothetical protein Ancab_022038 [Ancistrocladus abbreviatus]
MISHSFVDFGSFGDLGGSPPAPPLDRPGYLVFLRLEVGVDGSMEDRKRREAVWASPKLKNWIYKAVENQREGDERSICSEDDNDWTG